jgi:anti-sigma regulatory factor (Ser/Thr protein kinase)
VIERADFPNEPTSVAAARHFVSTAFDGLGQEKHQLAQLMVSELATNAVKHANSAFSVAVHRDNDGSVCIEVLDGGSGSPRKRHPAPLEPTGRGLLIVDTFADEWGIVERGGGKMVWFRVSSVSASGASRARRSAGDVTGRGPEPAGTSSGWITSNPRRRRPHGAESHLRGAQRADRPAAVPGAPGPELRRRSQLEPGEPECPSRAPGQAPEPCPRIRAEPSVIAAPPGCSPSRR